MLMERVEKRRLSMIGQAAPPLPPKTSAWCAARRESFSLRNMKTKYKLQSIIVDKVLNKHKSMNQAMQ